MGHRRHLLAAVAGIGCWALSAGVAQADVIHVRPGHSIQQAVNRAEPGDVVKLAPGRYLQNVTITKHGITLRGSGSGEHGSRLVSGGAVVPGPCNSPGSVNGVCVAGTHDVIVRDLSVRRWSGFGVILFQANHVKVHNVRAANNDGYGISGFVLHRVTFTHNVAVENHEPGFYIGDSPNAQAVVAHNRALRNGVNQGEGIGFLFRDASWGRVVDDTAKGNCVGMVFVNTGAPGPAAHWWAADNDANRNNRACPAEQDGAPPFSGLGIFLFGARNTTLWENETNGNRPNGPSVASGGIAVASSVPAGGSTPANNLIKQNDAENNSPFDIMWDRSGFNNRFVNNDCETSSPAFICS